MPDFLFFNIANSFATEKGEPCSLKDHLEYLNNYGGTADCLDYFNGSESDALVEAAKLDLEIYVVETMNYTVVGIVNCK